MNVDRQGNLLYCDHIKRDVWELPVVKFDRHANPNYDWARVGGSCRRTSRR
jgi:hypothetical protein